VLGLAGNDQAGLRKKLLILCDGRGSGCVTSTWQIPMTACGLEAEVVAGLAASLLAERGQGSGALGAGAAVDEGPAARVFELGELCIEDAWPRAECLGSLLDAGVFGDHEQPAEALPDVAPGEGVAEWFGQVAWVAAGCRAGKNVHWSLISC
jgi:hypothetical protein